MSCTICINKTLSKRRNLRCSILISIAQRIARHASAIQSDTAVIEGRDSVLRGRACGSIT